MDRTIPTEDERLRERILAELTVLGFTGLRVGVHHGIVHLAGEVPSMSIRQIVANLARQTPGVRGVANRINAPGAPHPDRTINLMNGEENDQVPQ